MPIYTGNLSQYKEKVITSSIFEEIKTIEEEKENEGRKEEENKDENEVKTEEKCG